MSTKSVGFGVAAVLVVLIAVLTVIDMDHGGDDSLPSDGAFIAEMVPHHESAIEMADIALKQAEHTQIRALADAISSSQQAEITELVEIHQRIFGQPVSANHQTLGLPSEELGMHMDTSNLASQRPFDKAFIDMMIPHHQGAIVMARIELAEGEDAELKQLARAIIAAQGKEITEMNEWRERWYGAPSPAGGIQKAGEDASPSHEEMGH